MHVGELIDFDACGRVVCVLMCGWILMCVGVS